MSTFGTPDDVSGEYQAYRQMADASSAVSDFERRMQARVPQPAQTAQPGEEAPTATAPATPAAQPEVTREYPAVPPGYRQEEVVNRETGEVQQFATSPDGLHTMRVGTRIAKDVGLGLVEAPRQIMGGARDAVQEFYDAVKSISDIGDQYIDLTIPGTEEWKVELPEVDAARSGTGGAVRSVSQFLTGFIPAMKAMKGLKAGGEVAGNIVRPMIAGAATDALTRDPHEERLANMWKELDLPENVITDFLAADPADTDAEGRVKNSLEGAGLGALSEAIVWGAKAARAARRARQADADAPAAADPGADQVARYGEVTERDMLILGDPNEPLLRVGTVEPADGAAKFRAAEAATETGVPTDFAARGMSKTAAEPLPRPAPMAEEVFINFARIDTADDVKSVIGQMADAFSANIDEARRGVQSNEATAELADRLGMTVPDLLARRKGQPFNAEEALAARRLWAASAEKLAEVAERAADPNAGMIDQFNFRKMMAIHYAIQAEVIAARTETARALQSWSIPAGGSVEKARAIQQLMDGMGGTDVSREMARRISALKEQGGNPAAIDAAVRHGWGATTMDAVKESYVLGLLWSPSTHIVNVGSNLSVAVQQIYERGLARGMTVLRGNEDGVASGEAAAMAYGLLSGMKDAFRLAGRSLVTGETGASLGKIDLPHKAAISAEAFRLSGDSPLGRAVDFMGTVTRAPGRLLGAEDEFFKTISYRMELHAQAVRQAAREGYTDPAELKKRIGEIVNSPPEHVRIRAADAALYNTFTNQPGKWGEAVMRTRDQIQPAILALPFVRTPTNILRYTFERTPLAPFVKQWREDIAAGGARADIALARMASGSIIMALAGDYAMSGLVTGAGPKDFGEREAWLRSGKQPFSIRVGDNWYSYNRTDPFGMLMGFSATMVELSTKGDADPDDMDEWQEVMAAGIAAVSASVTSKTYFEGVSRLFAAMEEPERYSANYINQTVGSFLPFTTATGTAARAIDPVMRDANNPWDAVQARLPGLSSRLTPKRDIWGQERKQDGVYGATYDILSPIRVTSEKDSPIDKELVRLNWGPTRIPKKARFAGADVNFRDWPEVYDAYVRLAGNELKDPVSGLGAKDFLDAVVSGKHPLSTQYEQQSDGPDGGKALFISKVVSNYRKAAQAAILADPAFSDFADSLGDRRVEEMDRRLPVTQ